MGNNFEKPPRPEEITPEEKPTPKKLDKDAPIRKELVERVLVEPDKTPPDRSVGKIDKNAATSKQIAWFKAYNLVPPPTKAACSSIITYIKRGNGTIGKDEGDRINITAEFQDQWLGQEVKKIDGKKKEDPRMPKGRVLYLRARKENEINSIKRNRKDHPDNQPIRPFDAWVQHEDGKRRTHNLSYLKILKEENTEQ